MTTPAELPIGIHIVLVTDNTRLRDAFAKAIATVSGIQPAMTSRSESADRLHYPEARAKLIINTASAAMHERLGRHYAVAAIEVADRVLAAEQAAAVFRVEGFEAVVHRHAEPEFPPDFLTFVQVKEQEGILLMFWPRPQDVQAMAPDLLAQLPKREPWSGFPPLNA